MIDSIDKSTKSDGLLGCVDAIDDSAIWHGHTKTPWDENIDQFLSTSECSEKESALGCWWGHVDSVIQLEGLSIAPLSVLG